MEEEERGRTRKTGREGGGEEKRKSKTKRTGSGGYMVGKVRFELKPRA